MSEPAEPVLNIVTTTGMVKDMVINIGGDRVAVDSIMREGVDPHLYQPTAADVRKVLVADLIFANGLNLEGRMTDVFVAVAIHGQERRTRH